MFGQHIDPDDEFGGASSGSATEPSSEPFGAAAQEYLDAGWWPLPMLNDLKGHPPTGYTGNDGKPVTQDEVDEWSVRYADRNIAIRQHPGETGEEARA